MKVQLVRLREYGPGVRGMLADEKASQPFESHLRGVVKLDPEEDVTMSETCESEGSGPVVEFSLQTGCMGPMSRPTESVPLVGGGG